MKKLYVYKPGSDTCVKVEDVHVTQVYSWDVYVFQFDLWMNEILYRLTYVVQRYCRQGDFVVQL